MAFNECHNINAPGTYESVDIIVTYAVLYGRLLSFTAADDDVVGDDESSVVEDVVVAVVVVVMSELGERIILQLFRRVGGRPAFLHITINPRSNSNHSFIPFNSCRRCRCRGLLLPLRLLLLFGRVMSILYSNERPLDRAGKQLFASFNGVQYFPKSWCDCCG